MYALTVRQPWAHAIAHLGKDVENRTRAPNRDAVGQRVAIHAGYYYEADEDMLALARIVGVGSLPYRSSFRRGGLVAVATIAGWFKLKGGRVTRSAGGATLIAEARESRWAAGPCCWVLRDTVALREPVLASGRQGLWRLDGRQEEALRAALEEQGERAPRGVDVGAAAGGPAVVLPGPTVAGPAGVGARADGEGGRRAGG